MYRLGKKPCMNFGSCCPGAWPGDKPKKKKRKIVQELDHDDPASNPADDNLEGAEAAGAASAGRLFECILHFRLDASAFQYSC